MFQTMKKTLIAVALISMTTGAALAATGAKTGVNGGAKAADGAANQKGEAAALSVQLARYGDKNKDALAMIMAARLQSQRWFTHALGSSRSPINRCPAPFAYSSQNPASTATIEAPKSWRPRSATRAWR